MQLILKVGIWLLQILYFPFKYLPIQNKVVYISRQSEEIPKDFLLIRDELEKINPEVQSIFLIKPIKKGITNKILYMLHMFRQMYHIATSKMVLLDGYCILISILKHRKTLIIIQMWHAIGALKKFGYSILDRGEGRKREIAIALKMHKNYTYVFASGEKCKTYFSEAFGQPIEKVKVFPLPRLDLLHDKGEHDIIRSQIYRRYPQLCAKAKKVIVYAPTFRKEEEQLICATNNLLKNIDYTKYNVVIKPHPLSKIAVAMPKVIVDEEFTTEEMFIVADIIIADYSAVLFEALFLEKNLLLYAYDYDSYCKNRDFYIDYGKIFKDIICESAEKIVEQIANVDNLSLNYKQFIKSMVRETKIGYTREIVLFLNSLLKCE